jgi:hypothetical protein
MEKEFTSQAEEFMRQKYSIYGYRSFFGVSLQTTVSIWEYIEGVCSEKHLLWTLYFLKINPNDNVNLYPVSKKTWQKYVYKVIDVLYHMLPSVETDRY